MKEIWKPVPFYPYDAKYSVSNLGRVKPNVVSKYSKNKAEFLKPVPTPRGYLFVSLYAEGKTYCAFIHRMVTIAFHGKPPADKPYACHKDDCQTNNRTDNLYWGSHADNTRDREENGKGSKGASNGRAMLTPVEVAEIRRLYADGNVSQTSLGKQFHIGQVQISRIVRGEHWTI